MTSFSPNFFPRAPFPNAGGLGLPHGNLGQGAFYLHHLLPVPREDLAVGPRAGAGRTLTQSAPELLPLPILPRVPTVSDGAQGKRRRQWFPQAEVRPGEGRDSQGSRDPEDMPGCDSP